MTGWLGVHGGGVAGVVGVVADTVNAALAVLSAGFGSLVSELIVAVLTIVPVAPAVTTAPMVMVAVAPTGKSPSVQSTVWPLIVHATLPDSDGPLTPAGNVSTTCTPLAGDGPALVAVSW